MKKIFFFLIILITSLKAQTSLDISYNNKISFAYGQAYNLMLDRTYSRLAKNGFNHFFNFKYENKKIDYIFNIQNDFMIGYLSTNGNNINLVNKYSNKIIIHYLGNINKLTCRNFVTSIGLNLGFRGNIWFPNESYLRYAWDINSGFGSSIRFLYRLSDKFNFQIDSDLFLVGLLWRSHNNSQQLTTEEIQLEKGIVASAFEVTRFSNLFNTIYIDNSFYFTYLLSKNVNLYYNFIFSYQYITKPLLKKGYVFTNTVGLKINF